MGRSTTRNLLIRLGRATSKPAKDLIKPRRSIGIPAVLGLLQVRQPSRLGVDILNLLGAGGVKVNQLLAGGALGSLLKVRCEASEERVGSSGQAVASIGSLGLVCGVGALIELLDGVDKLVGDTVLLVELDGCFETGIGDEVAMSEDLSEDAGAGLLFLCQASVGGAIGGGVIGMGIVRGGAARDGDFVGAELGVVEEESSAGGGLLLEVYGRGLGLALGGDVDGVDLATGRCVSRANE